eukprot:Hpha_TRINITY_DN8219_c0_g1::TRINITY_DN8219_c0_g1_i1::g.111872::m.111872
MPGGSLWRCRGRRLLPFLPVVLLVLTLPLLLRPPPRQRQREEGVTQRAEGRIDPPTPPQRSGRREAVSCADTRVECADWAEAGECTKRPDAMREQCAVSCGACGNGPLLHLSSSVGTVPIRLRPELAPSTVRRLVRTHTAGDGCKQCRWYRAEGVPLEPPPSCGAIGPCGPYSLVQGYLAGLEGAPGEEKPFVMRGDVARIQGGDFFVSLGDHSGWGHAFTVFGRVEEGGMEVVEAMTRMRWREATSGQTKMRLLEEPVQFTARLG